MGKLSHNLLAIIAGLGLGMLISTYIEMSHTQKLATHMEQKLQIVERLMNNP